MEHQIEDNFHWIKEKQIVNNKENFDEDSLCTENLLNYFNN